MERNFMRYGMILFGCLLSCSSINLFLVPHKLLSGGISGIAIIFYYLWEWRVSYTHLDVYKRQVYILE